MSPLAAVGDSAPSTVLAKLRIASTVDLIVRVFAGAVAAALVLVACLHVSRAWDGWAYHLPFAARLAGIVGPSAYVFGPTNAARFEGFPLLAEALEGVLWRVTGHPEAANFVALASLVALVLFLWRVFRVPIHTAFLGLVAIPLVMIHATAPYVDIRQQLHGDARSPGIQIVRDS